MDEVQKGILDSVYNRGRGDIADAIGMPDHQDYEVLCKIFEKFCKRQFTDRNGIKFTGADWLKAAVDMGRHDYHTGTHRKTQFWQGKTFVNKESHMEYVFEFPAPLYEAIEAVFPSMFRSKKHFNWLKRNFARLTIGGDQI